MLVRASLVQLGLFIGLMLATSSCGFSPRSRATLSSPFPNTTGTAATNGTNPNNLFNIGLNSNSGSNQSSQQQQRPTSGPLVAPSSQLGGGTPWDYMSRMVPPSNPQTADARAVVTPGKYRFVVGPQMAISPNHVYSLYLPPTVNYAYGDAGCAAGPQGHLQPQTTLCVEFTQPTLIGTAPLALRLTVQGPQINSTQTLWVLVLAPPERPADQLRIVIQGGSIQGPPAVVITQKVYINEQDGRSQFTVAPSEFSASLQGSGQGMNVTNISVEPATAGTATRVANSNEFRVSITQGGPLRLLARGNDSYGAFDISLNIAVPRQVNAVWTRNSTTRPAPTSAEVSGLICSNGTNASVAVQIVPETTSAFPLSLAPFRTDAASNTFPPGFDFGFNRMAAKATVTLPGDTAVGAVRCRAVTYTCADMTRSACVSTLRQDFWIGRDRL